MSFLSNLRKSARAATLTTFLAAMSPFVAAPAVAQRAPQPPVLPALLSPSELAAAPFTYYIPAGAHAAGQFDSQWRLDLLLRNSAPVGSPPGDIILYAHPRGQAASPNDPSYAFSLPAGASVWLPDVLGTITSEPLAAWVEARSTSTLSINEAYIHNLASTGDKTGSALPVFNAATLATDQRLLREGDRVEFLLIGSAQYARENTLLWVAPTSCDATATPVLVDQMGNEIAHGAPLTVPAGAYVQQTVEEAVGHPVGLGNVLRTTLACATGSTTPLLAWNGVTQINTRNPQYQDSIILEGTKYPLLETADYRWSPNAIEANDPLIKQIALKARSDVTIKDIYEDVNNDGVNDNIWHPSTNSFDNTVSSTATVAGTYTPSLYVTFQDEQGHFAARKILATPFTVSAEKDGYVATKEDAQAYVLGNLKEAGLLASRGTLDGKAYTGTEWEARWTSYFNAASPANSRINRIVFNDVGDGLLNGGNIMVLYMDDGSYQADRSLPDAYIDTLKSKMKAKLPQ